MTATTDTIGAPRAFNNGTASASLVALVTAIATGDWLLWTSYPALSFALFLAGLAGLQTALSWQRLDRQRMLYAGNLLMLGLAPLLEEANWLSMIIAVSGTFAACLILRSEQWLTTLTRWPERLDAFVTAALNSVSRFPLLIYGYLRSPSLPNMPLALIRGWLVPCAFAAIFVLLFTFASPVWQGWLQSIAIGNLLSIIFSTRALFWIALAWFFWPFVERAPPVVQGVRWAKFGFDLLKMQNSKLAPKESFSVVFFERCLILFNAVFAIQTLLDFVYLWGGVTLPEGMSYAEYAHRGAYPLVAAALLAALFVVITMRPGGAGERSPRVKWLVLAWVAQNVMLVGSSVLRLDLYIEAYALTYWRVAAFIWMGLVASGLLLIVARFLLQRSSGWLISANVAVLATALYAVSFVNLPNVIARYNLEHSSLSIAGGSTMDYRYLKHLGPHAFPAVAEFVEDNPLIAKSDKLQLVRFARAARWNFAPELGSGWRSWTWRKHRVENAMRKYDVGPTFYSSKPASSVSGASSNVSRPVVNMQNRKPLTSNLPSEAIR